VRSIYVFDVHIIEKPPKISSLYGFNKVKEFLFFVLRSCPFAVSFRGNQIFTGKIFPDYTGINKICIFVV
jgi:hypothetical protein